MNNKTIFIGIFTCALLTGCDSQSKQMDKEAEICDKAIEIGELEMAEERCQMALGDLNADILAPDISSQRLLKLGSIKRQLGKYVEAGDLIRESLAIEEKLSGPESVAVGLRLVEMALINAGQMYWERGAHDLQRLLPICDQFPERERLVTANILKHYAKELKHTDQAELALEFEAKAEQLKNMEKAERINDS